MNANGLIRGVVTAVPANIVGNVCNVKAQQAEKLTGVFERRVSAGSWDGAPALARAAAAAVLEGVGWPASSLSLIVYVTQTPELLVPADVYPLARDLGAPDDCVCMQVNWSCAGYVYGLLTAMRLLDAEDRALLIVGDATSTIVDAGDRATAPLFGDAVSATAIEGAGDEYGHAFHVGTDGMGSSSLMQHRHGKLAMDGAAVFNFTIARVPELVERVLCDDPAPDYLLFHQANRFMLSHLVKKCELLGRFTSEQIPTNLEFFGNTSSASIPLLMCTHLAKPLTERYVTTLALFGFGAGWAWAGASLTVPQLSVCKWIEI